MPKSLDQIPADQLELFSRVHETHVAAKHNTYVGAAVTASFSVGPKGAHLHGWITYLNEAKTLHFVSTSVQQHSGVGAGVMAFPTVITLNYDLLVGQTASAFFAKDALLCTLNSDDSTVFKPILPLVGTGWKPVFRVTVDFTTS